MRLAGLILAVGLAIVLAVTNPTSNDFRQWVGEQIAAEMREGGYGFLVGITRALRLEQYVDATRQDYLIFSIHRLHHLGNTYTFLGIANRFYSLDPNPSLQGRKADQLSALAAM